MESAVYWLNATQISLNLQLRKRTVIIYCIVCQCMSKELLLVISKVILSNFFHCVLIYLHVVVLCVIHNYTFQFILLCVKFAQATVLGDLQNYNLFHSALIFVQAVVLGDF